MRIPDGTGRIIFGFVLAVGISVTLPYVAFGAGRSVASSGKFSAPGMRRQHSIPRRFDRFGIVGVGGSDARQVIIIQQLQLPATTEPGESKEKGMYVLPHWVDAGHGVQVLRPGYWTDPTKAAEH